MMATIASAFKMDAVDPNDSKWSDYVPSPNWVTEWTADKMLDRVQAWVGSDAQTARRRMKVVKRFTTLALRYSARPMEWVRDHMTTAHMTELARRWNEACKAFPPTKELQTKASKATADLAFPAFGPHVLFSRSEYNELTTSNASSHLFSDDEGSDDTEIQSTTEPNPLTGRKRSLSEASDRSSKKRRLIGPTEVGNNMEKQV